jgi:hypothetical protein
MTTAVSAPALEARRRVVAGTNHLARNLLEDVYAIDRITLCLILGWQGYESLFVNPPDKTGDAAITGGVGTAVVVLWPKLAGHDKRHKMCLSHYHIKTLL